MSDYAKINDLETTLVEYMKAKIKSSFPNTDITENSPLMDMLIYPWATLASQLTTFGTSIESRTNLKNVANLSDQDIDDIGEGNYFIERGEGSKSVGSCTFSFESVSNTQNTLIPEGLPVSTKTGLIFVVTETLSLTPSEMYTKWSTDDLTYKVTVPVESIEAGSKYNVVSGDISVITKTFTDHVTTVVNNGVFTGGSDVESSASYLARIKSFYSSRTLETQSGYKQQVMERFPEVTDVAVAGYKDPLMTRDRVNMVTVEGVTLTNVNIGGKVDIYIKGVNVETNEVSIISKSNLYLFKRALALIDGESIIVQNVRTAAFLTVALSNIQIISASPNLYLKVINGFDEGDSIKLTYNYGETSESPKILSETFYFTIDRPSQRFVVKGPFVSCISVIDTTANINFGIGDGAPSPTTFTLTASLSEGMGAGTIDLIGTSREELVFTPKFDLLNGNTIKTTYSYISTIKEIGDFYDIEANRVVTRDVLVKKAQECYFFIEIEVKLNEGIAGSLSTDGAIFNTVSAFFGGKTMASKIDESDIVNELYENTTTSSIVDYIKVAFKTFHKSTDPNEEFVSGVRDGSSIQLGRIEYPSLHTLRVIYL